MVFINWEEGTDYKNISTISSCNWLDMGGVGNLRPDWFLDSRPYSSEAIQTQYLGNQHIYDQGKARLVKQWRKKDFVNTYFVASMQEHVGEDGIHWPLTLNVPGEGAGPDTFRILTNHTVLQDSDDELFLVDEAYMAAGGSCPTFGPPSPPPADAWQCSVCQHTFDAEKDGAGSSFEDLADDWTCPVCDLRRARTRSPQRLPHLHRSRVPST